MKRKLSSSIIMTSSTSWLIQETRKRRDLETWPTTPKPAWTSSRSTKNSVRRSSKQPSSAENLKQKKKRFFLSIKVTKFKWKRFQTSTSKRLKAWRKPSTTSSNCSITSTRDTTRCSLTSLPSRSKRPHSRRRTCSSSRSSSNILTVSASTTTFSTQATRCWLSTLRSILTGHQSREWTEFHTRPLSRVMLWLTT